MCNNKDFVHLHCHTHYSIQDALPTPEKLVLAAKEQGFSSIAVTDHGKMASHIEFVSAAKNNGIKPICGVEFYVAKNRFDKNILLEDGKKSREKLAHLTVLAQTSEGYKNMLQLGYEASKPECYHYNPRIDFNLLSEYSNGLIVLSGCLASELNQALLRGTYEEGLAVAQRYKDVFGERYFIELQYHGIEDQKKNLPLLIKIAKELNIKTVASNDVHYINPTDWKLHDVLIQMRDLRDDKGSTKKNGKKEAYGTHQFWLKSYDQMYDIFGAKIPDAVKNTRLIAEMVEDYYQLDVPHLLPEGKVDYANNNFVNFWKSKLEHHDAKEAYLAYQGFLGLKKLGLEKNPEYVKRLKYEIETIWHMGVVDYFLIQKEMVDFMKANDIMFGVRGSGVGSLLNYCLGISYADPIKFGLLFERFLNPGRGNQYLIDLEGYTCEEKLNEDESSRYIRSKCKDFLSLKENEKYEPRVSRELWILENQKMMNPVKSAYNNGFKLKQNKSNFVVFYIMGLIDKMPVDNLIIKKVSGLPDIDTDIDDKKRHIVFEWAKNRFGEENVKSVGTWGTYKAKASIQGTLKTSDKFKKQYGDGVSAMALKISGTIPKGDYTIEKAVNESPDFAYWANRFKEETLYASRLYGTISNLGVHAAAIVVSSRPIHHNVPIENSKGTLCTAFDMNDVEKTGTIKYDYLGLTTYCQITKALKLIKERHNVDIDLLNMPLDDKRVYKEVFEKGNTATIFQFSSPGMQDSLKKVKPTAIEDLIAVAALFRPGPLQYIPDYAKGKQNPSSIKYAHPLIEKHLSPTYGIMVYQEQAMFLAREMAALDWGEVDKLRKGISKKSSKQFEEACSNFSTKAAERGIPNSVINEVLQLMSKFGEYAFNKSHSCMYAIVGYWTAYLKVYYPSEWMAACIESEKDDADKVESYITECERLNLKVNMPCVNVSKMSTTVADDNSIFLPLTSLKGVGESAHVIEENKPYENLMDFVVKSGCNKSLYVALASGGALDNLVSSEDAHDTYFLDFWMEYSKNKAKKNTKRASINVNTNNMSLLEIRDLSNKESSDNKLLSMLDDF